MASKTNSDRIEISSRDGKLEPLFNGLTVTEQLLCQNGLKLAVLRMHLIRKSFTAEAVVVIDEEGDVFRPNLDRHRQLSTR